MQKWSVYKKSNEKPICSSITCKALEKNYAQNAHIRKNSKKSKYASNPKPKRTAARGRYAADPEAKRTAERIRYASNPKPQQLSSILSIGQLYYKGFEHNIPP